MKLQSEFSCEFLKTIFVRMPPLASAARCGPHPLTTPLSRPSIDICRSLGVGSRYRLTAAGAAYRLSAGAQAADGVH